MDQIVQKICSFLRILADNPKMVEELLGISPSPPPVVHPSAFRIGAFTGNLVEADKCVILDTETTGLSELDRVVELSIIDFRGRILYNGLFNPEMPMPEKASEINGITDKILCGQPLFSEKAETIRTSLKDRTVIGWNVDFDMRMLETEFSKLNIDAPWAFGWDAMSSFARSRGMNKNWYGNYSCKLAKAKEILGLGDSQGHRSLADCYDTLAVMDEFIIP